MRLHRIHTPMTLEPGREIVLGEGTSHYLGRVLRVVAGQRLVLFNGDGHDYAAEVLRPGRKGMVVTVASRLPGLAESPLRLIVVQGVSRGERMDQTLQKCTELGAAAFQPLSCERSGVRLRGERLERRLEHWRSVVVSACEQCGRAVVPPVRAPLTLPEWLATGSGGLRVALTPAASEGLSRFVPAERMQLAVGPEGGFSGPELESMQAAGVRPASLGRRVLRTETAAPAAVAILQSRAGDLQ